MIQFVELIESLVKGKIDFVVVGGVAAVIHGASRPTKDVDVCIEPSRETWSRVADLIRPLHPRYALTPDKRPITATTDELSAFRNLYVLTDLGRIDFLSEIAPLGDFAAVAARAVTVSVGELSVQVISLDDLITVKEHVRRPHDLAVAVELRAIRDVNAGR